MNSCEFTSLAIADLNDIYDFIANDSPTAAAGFVTLLEERCYRLADTPMIGRSRSELASNLRSFPIETYVIFYRPIPSGIEIARVLHGSRDIEALF